MSERRVQTERQLNADFVDFPGKRPPKEKSDPFQGRKRLSIVEKTSPLGLTRDCSRAIMQKARTGTPAQARVTKEQEKT
jgi:hypothetical protein